ncbi:MAG: type VI secretion system baseplate subunit TssF, partial [Syntrophorhabdales bacterium]
MREIRSKLDTYYRQELERLRSLAAEFARAHPAAAAPPQGPLAGPEAERLLEGVAFLTGLIREKLDDEFPEF